MTPADPRDQPDRSDEGTPEGSAAPVEASFEASLDDRVSAALDYSSDHGTPPTPSDPAVADRMAEMAAARDLLRVVPPPDPRRRDRAIDAALAAFDEEVGEGSPTGPTVGRSDELAARRADGSHRRRAARRVLAAAAALVVVAAVGVAVARSGDDGTTTASETMDTGAGQGDDAESSGGDSVAERSTAPPDEDGSAGAAGAPESGAPPIPALGEHPSVGSLLDAAAGVEAAPTEPQTTADNGFGTVSTLAARCPAGVPDPIAEAGGEARPVAGGTVDGEPIEVWHGGAPDAAVLVAIAEGCRVVATRPVG